MKASPHIAGLSTSVQKHLDEYGVDTLEKLNAASFLMLHWLKHLHDSQRTGTADQMLTGVGSLIRECAATLSLGLVRSAMLSMRGQIDLVLSWLYFKDHHVELNIVEREGEGYKLKGEVWKYLQTAHPKFGARFTVLEQCATRKAIDPYRLLSGHIHGQSAKAIPAVKSLEKVVSSFTDCERAIELQGYCAEYLNDILLAIYLDDWHAIPKPIQLAFEQRDMSAKQKAEFFK